MRATIYKITAAAFLLPLLIQCKNSNMDVSFVPDEYELVWSDEFESDGLPDTLKWEYRWGDGCPDVCGFGNNELQYYSKDRIKNARVENGSLIIEAHKEDYKTCQYTSARLRTPVNNGWLYGYFEIRAKLPSGTGTWPAIWMMPTEWKYGNWPHSGEIDIMEHVGYNPDSIKGTVHTGAFNHILKTQKGHWLLLEDCEEAYHTYAVEWTAEKMDFSVDGNCYYTFNNEGTGFEAWPFDRKFRLILNIAVGGNLGGKMGVDDTIWPQKMEVDYVRVYQK